MKILKLILVILNVILNDLEFYFFSKNVKEAYYGLVEKNYYWCKSELWFYNI
jgi:hypothetical protein